MKYILDFDEVLFDTTRLKQHMKVSGVLESARDGEVLEMMQASNPTFDMQQLVFPDALEFLRTHGADCVVVSSASSVNPHNNTDTQKQEDFQMQKIVLSGVAALVHDQVRVVSVTKSQTLRALQEEFVAQEILFVDDRIEYLQEAHALGIESVWMNRSAAKSSVEDTFRCITSFDEL